MAVRGHHNSPDFCHHWYLTFDGNKCANPDNIEVLDYSATTGNLHRAIDSKFSNKSILNVGCLSKKQYNRI